AILRDCGVELASKLTFPKTWTVNGVSRANAHLVSRDAENRPVYGGTLRIAGHGAWAISCGMG
ncbi:MAG: hypothetical protein J0I48_09230, partial [Devosia sp.]|nr:hypothetical protein [Devosia sp.]